jgi:hypothetical protein
MMFSGSPDLSKDQLLAIASDMSGSFNAGATHAAAQYFFDGAGGRARSAGPAKESGASYRMFSTNEVPLMERPLSVATKGVCDEGY